MLNLQDQNPLIPEEMVENDRVLFSALKSFLDDKKAENIALLDMEGHDSYFSYILIATALSDSHLKSLADESIRFMREKKHEISSFNTKEYDTGWAVLDFGDLVLHLFLQDMREKYNLEELYIC